MSELKLYSYWRSSTSYKVRIALNLKGLDYKITPVHLVKDGGEQHKSAYNAMNPMSAVPTLVDGDFVLTQSNAILEYLEEEYPTPALLPKDIPARAYIRQIMNIVSCDIHPLNNLRVLQHLKNDFKVSDKDKNAWYHKWIHKGFKALNELISKSEFYGGIYSYQNMPSFAEATLIPQIYNARRFDVNLKDYPVLTKIEESCLALDAFKNAHPDGQPDAQN